MDPDRWESGSEFHWPGWPALSVPESVPWSSGVLLSSGRDALRLALDLGARERGWRRLWIPDYFCQHVVAALAQSGLEILAYPDHPLRQVPNLPDARPGDAILVMNFLGLRGSVESGGRNGVAIIEDHSHDPTSPWAFASTADFCIASLRKSIPLSDGGVIWSPRGHVLPPAPPQTLQRSRTASTKLTAMILKAMYLDGQPVAKPTYRALAMRAERGLAVPGVSAMSDVSRAILESFPIAAWRRARAVNHGQLSSLLGPVEWARVLVPAEPGCVPFTCAVAVDSAPQRDHVRRGLAAAGVFAAVLWPLERTIVPVGREARGLSRRMLMIHCDGRYGASDMERIGEIVSGITRL